MQESQETAFECDLTVFEYTLICKSDRVFTIDQIEFKLIRSVSFEL